MLDSDLVYHFLNHNNPDVMWIVSSLQHMAKMLLWEPHTMGLRNVRLIIQWVTNASSTSTLPTLLPMELIESLRARIKECKNQGMHSQNEIQDIVSRMKNAGININREELADL